MAKTLTESSMEAQNAQRNFHVDTDDSAWMIAVLANEKTYRDGEGPALSPREIVTNQDLAHVLISIASKLLEAPHSQRLP